MLTVEATLDSFTTSTIASSSLTSLVTTASLVELLGEWRWRRGNRRTRKGWGKEVERVEKVEKEEEEGEEEKENDKEEEDEVVTWPWRLAWWRTAAGGSTWG